MSSIEIQKAEGNWEYFGVVWSSLLAGMEIYFYSVMGSGGVGRGAGARDSVYM